MAGLANYGWRTQAFIALVAVVGVVAVAAFSLARKRDAAAFPPQEANEPPRVDTPKAQEERQAPQALPPPAQATARSAEATFDKVAAVERLVGAAGKAQSCRTPRGPTGTGKVVVTFANSGRVSQASVFDAPYAGTPAGRCVAALFRAIEVPAFTGDAVTVTRRFSIE